MDFEMSEERTQWQRRVREFVRTALMPYDDQIEQTGQIPDEAVKGLREMGMFGLNTPKKYGGLGLPMLETCIAMQELAKAHIAYYYLSGVNVHIGSKAIEFEGTEEQKQRWLPELASGRVIGAFALTEPDAGSDVGSISTTAVRDGDDYVLNGRKIYITNAPVAGLFTVFAKTDSEARKSGISAFLVEADRPGLEIGQPIDMLAGNGSGHAEVVFNECRIPAANRLGEEGRGFSAAMRCLDIGRVTWGSYSVGAAERLFELAVERANTRHQFGRPLLANQGVEWQLVDMYAAIHSARLVNREAAWLYDQSSANSSEKIALSKLISGEMVFKVADATLQLFGGAGYSKDFPIERIWREVRVVRILDGTSEMMRRIVAQYAIRNRGEL